MRFFSISVLFAILLSVLGCAGTAPEETGGTAAESVPRPSERASADSSGQAEPSGKKREVGLGALRAAYVDGDYETVVRRARVWRRDSLEGTEAISVNTLLGRAQQARGRDASAIRALRRARVAASERRVSSVAIDRALGESYVALYRWPQAASAFRRVLDAEPQDRAARHALAEVYRRSRQWGAALRQYRHLVQADSSNGQWWSRLGQCALQQGMTKRARRHFANAHERLPQSTEVALSLSRLHRAQGDLEAARRVVDESLKHQAGDPRLWRRRADLAFERNELDRARRAYRQTIATGDSSATAYRRIGLIDVQRQEYARALSPLQQSRNRDSTHTRTTLYLGIAFLKLDSLQRATTHFRRTVEREARGPITRALEQLGTAQSHRGAVTEAVEAYKTALRLQPARAPVLFHLATTYDEQYRDKRPAARYYRRFLEVEAGGLPQLRRYAERRLDALRPTLHMQEGDATSALP